MVKNVFIEAVFVFVLRMAVLFAAVVLTFAAVGCVPERPSTVRHEAVAIEADPAAVAAEEMPIARGIYPDLPFEPTAEDLESGFDN
mgnify:FL=1|nr:MAG TPA: hypothetical protein [Caudoviricetes sp.]